MRPSPPGEAGLETRLGYRFRHRELLAQALTHPSSGAAEDNQRLEYLGDALLYAALSLLIYREKAGWTEGHMSKLRHLLVSTEALHAWAADLGLQLRTAGGSADPAKLKTAFRKPLADAMEAVLAAVFLDAQRAGEAPMDPVLRLVEGRFLGEVRAAQVGVWEQHDPKTTLQERAAVLGLPHPAYELLGRSGPDHAPRFSVRVVVGPHVAEAEEGTRRRAEAQAAATLLGQLPPR